MYLFEVSAEVCYKLGGIHTVISSKIPYMQERWGDNYVLVGPYIPWWNYEGSLEMASEQILMNEPLENTIRSLRAFGVNLYVGRWAIEGTPKVILLDPKTPVQGLQEYVTAYGKEYGIVIPDNDPYVSLYMQFGFLLELFFKELTREWEGAPDHMMVHFHEYLTAVGLPAIRRLNIRTVFTVHATVLGRFLAGADKLFHQRVNWNIAKGIRKLSPYHRFSFEIERIAASQCHVLTCVSDVVGRECAEFVNRKPDVITPNGLNTDLIRRETDVRAAADQVAQMLQRHFAGDIQTSMAKQFYFFSAGRYEYTNKGYDIVIRALAALNRWLMRSQLDITVYMVFITDTPYPHTSRLAKWFAKLASALSPARRTGDIFPFEVPAFFYESELVLDLKRHHLDNRQKNRVKVLYHPQFLSEHSGVLKMTYLTFVKFCDLGIFPSYYEPWGYTPMECICAGTPAVTSNVSGLGRYLAGKKHAHPGVFILDRTTGDAETALCAYLKEFVLREKGVDRAGKHTADCFDWKHMISYYDTAYREAMADAEQPSERPVHHVRNTTV